MYRLQKLLLSIRAKRGAKVKLYDAVNSGKVRILMGSTFKLGIGANVQTKLKAFITSMFRGDLRIWFSVKEEFCAQAMKTTRLKFIDISLKEALILTPGRFFKQNSISYLNFLAETVLRAVLKISQMDELNYAQVKALALFEPLMKEYVEKENALRNARLVLRQEIMQKETAKLDIKRIDEEQKQLDLRREKPLKTQNTWRRTLSI